MTRLEGLRRSSEDPAILRLEDVPHTTQVEDADSNDARLVAQMQAMTPAQRAERHRQMQAVVADVLAAARRARMTRGRTALRSRDW